MKRKQSALFPHRLMPCHPWQLTKFSQLPHDNYSFRSPDSARPSFVVRDIQVTAVVVNSRLER
ncbi:hypothetical protein EMIT0P74_100118 [Pseudomonas sp. IT-P74]